MVAISPCINAHGIVELASGHFSPLGQYTSEPDPWIMNKNALISNVSNSIAHKLRYLLLDAVSAAGKTEFVMTNGRTLNKMRVLQSFLTQCTLKRWIRCRCRRRSSRIVVAVVAIVDATDATTGTNIGRRWDAFDRKGSIIVAAAATANIHWRQSTRLLLRLLCFGWGDRCAGHVPWPRRTATTRRACAKEKENSLIVVDDEERKWYAKVLNDFPFFFNFNYVRLTFLLLWY